MICAHGFTGTCVQDQDLICFRRTFLRENIRTLKATAPVLQFFDVFCIVLSTTPKESLEYQGSWKNKFLYTSQDKKPAPKQFSREITHFLDSGNVGMVLNNAKDLPEDNLCGSTKSEIAFQRGREWIRKEETNNRRKGKKDNKRKEQRKDRKERKHKRKGKQKKEEQSRKQKKEKHDPMSRLTGTLMGSRFRFTSFLLPHDSLNRTNNSFK